MLVMYCKQLLIRLIKLIRLKINPKCDVFVRDVLADMLSSARVLCRLGRGMSQRLIVTEASLGLTHVMGEMRERQEKDKSAEKMLLPSLTASADRGLVLGSDLTRASDLVDGEEGLTVFKELLLK